MADGCDTCPNDADNDADADGVCGDVDVCPGFDDNVDTDEDGLADGCDTCPNDADNDADADGVCDDVDDCIGEYDECGVCNGSGIADGACDCDGYLLDCAGECGGSAVEDECGVCDGSGIADGACAVSYTHLRAHET